MQEVSFALFASQQNMIRLLSASNIKINDDQQQRSRVDQMIYLETIFPILPLALPHTTNHL